MTLYARFIAGPPSSRSYSTRGGFTTADFSDAGAPGVEKPRRPSTSIRKVAWRSKFCPRALVEYPPPVLGGGGSQARAGSAVATVPTIRFSPPEAHAEFVRNEAWVLLSSGDRGPFLVAATRKEGMARIHWWQ